MEKVKSTKSAFGDWIYGEPNDATNEFYKAVLKILDDKAQSLEDAVVSLDKNSATRATFEFGARELRFAMDKIKKLGELIKVGR